MSTGPTEANVRIAVELKDIVKTFGDVKALRGVSLELREGEIRALVGENGAGKTTLMNILYGMYRPDSGSISVRGRTVGGDWSPRMAMAAGIGMIHQHFSLIPRYTVLENIVMPQLTWRTFSWRAAQHRKRVVELCDTYGFSLDPDARVETLPVGLQQETEILKMLYQGAEILILDEPTAVLTPQQIEGLLQLLLRLRAEGHSVVLITHKLKEAMAVADHLTVMRGGRVVATVEKDATSIPEVATLMVSQKTDVGRIWDLKPPGSKVLLEVSNLTVRTPERERAVDGVSFALRAGEILGVAGVSGNGQTELVDAIVGLRRPVSGVIAIDGHDVSTWSILKRSQAGLSFIPENRETYGCVSDLSIADNLIYDRCTEKPFSRLGVLQGKAVRTYADAALKEFDVRAPDSQEPVCNLSGGNQQKVVLARILTGHTRIILANQPTRGLDFAATEFVREQLVKAAEQGVGVLLVSSELDELLALSHRIIVMFRGRIVGELTRDEFDVNRIGLLMAGHTDESVEARSRDDAGVPAGGEG